MSLTPRPKSLALMFVLGAFLTGGAVGFAADRAVTRSRPQRQFDERAGRDSLAQELNLTADQRRIFDSVMDWRRERSREIMQQYRPMLDSVRDSGRVLMMQALDTAQQAKLKALIEHNRRTSDSIMRARAGTK
ncbi:MAG: hypothetical protein ABMA00_09845 [Gemmatimonas sp.]